MERQARRQRTFWIVVLNVELATSPSASTTSSRPSRFPTSSGLVMIGVALGIVTMRFAAGVFTWMIKKEPILETAAYIVVFNIGVELLLGEFAGIHFEAWEKFLISAEHARPVRRCTRTCGVLHVFAPAFRWIAEGMGNVNELIDWALMPLVLLIKLIFRGIVQIVRALLPAHGRAEPGV